MTLLAPAGLGSGGGCGFGIEPVAAKRLMTRAMRAASESQAASAGGSGYKDLRRSMPAGPTSAVHVSGFSPFEREFLVHATEAAASLSWGRVLPAGGVVISETDPLNTLKDVLKPFVYTHRRVILVERLAKDFVLNTCKRC